MIPAGALGRWVVIAAWLAAGGGWAAAPESRQPPLVFYFELDGKRVPVELDQPFATGALGGAKAATLRLEPHREFSYARLRFLFPREFTFEANLGLAQLAMWTLSGNDCKIMIHRYAGRSNPEELGRTVVEQLREAFKGAKKKQLAAASLEAKGAVLSGTRLEVELAGTRISQEVYPIASGKDVVILIVQDSPGDEGPSTERGVVGKLLKDSLTLPK